MGLKLLDLELSNPDFELGAMMAGGTRSRRCFPGSDEDATGMVRERLAEASEPRRQLCGAESCESFGLRQTVRNFSSAGEPSQ